MKRVTRLCWSLVVCSGLCSLTIEATLAQGNSDATALASNGAESQSSTGGQEAQVGAGTAAAVTTGSSGPPSDGGGGGPPPLPGPQLCEHLDQQPAHRYCLSLVLGESEQQPLQEQEGSQNQEANNE